MQASAGVFRAPVALHACQRRSFLAACHSRPAQAFRAPLHSGPWTARLPAAHAGEPHSDTSPAQEELQDSESAAHSHANQQQDSSAAAEHSRPAANEALPQGAEAGSGDSQHSSQAAGQDSIPVGSFPSPADVHALLNSVNSLPRAERQQYIRHLQQAVQADDQQPGPDGEAPKSVEQRGDRQRRQDCLGVPVQHRPSQSLAGHASYQALLGQEFVCMSSGAVCCGRLSLEST